MVVWNGMDLNQELKLYSQSKKGKSNSTDDVYINLANTKNAGYTVPYIEKSNHLMKFSKIFIKELTKNPQIFLIMKNL